MWSLYYPFLVVRSPPIALIRSPGFLIVVVLKFSPAKQVVTSRKELWLVLPPWLL
jgi:hypothetical protein